MTGKFLAAFFLFLFLAGAVNAQTDTLSHSQSDTLSRAAKDSIINEFSQDTASLSKFQLYGSSQSFLNTGGKPVVNDVQQFNHRQRNGFVFVLLLVLLAALTYVKTAFGKSLEEMLQSIVNRNTSQQVFRTQSGEITFADVLLNANFIVAISLYARFFLINYFHVSSLDSFYSVLFLIFLFTFFYLFKIVSLRFIGNIFELQQACDEYIFNFTTVCKTLGLALLPALFVFYTAPVKIFNFLFAITVLFVILSLAIFVWRALSTSYKLLYRSVYHFFIYVCVVEISTVFLFFKLLTKTIP